MNIALVAEVKWEVRAVCRRLGLQAIRRRDGVCGGHLDGHEVRLCLSGMDPTVSKPRVERFLDSEPFDVMICTGLAGALREGIAAGDLILHSDDSRLLGSARGALARTGLRYHCGPLVTVASPVLTPDARRELASETRAIAVDLESQTIAALCRQRGIPCLAVKGVSDGLDDDLSPILGGFEVVDIPRIALSVITRPWTWGLAARMARQSHRAASHLGEGVLAALDAIAIPIE